MGPAHVIAQTYEVVRRLGAGGMGTVFEAKHVRLPKRVAVKVLTAAPDAELLARFRLEAEIASRLDHPHIVEMLDLGTLPSGVPYMVMELLDGENLRTRIRRGKPPLGESLRIVQQIASALRAAHGAGVIHRDLKPENVFLAREGLTGADHVKLLDFGISKVQGIALTANNVVLGTPAYMAPEQATGATLDARVDQFALAMIAYELLAGSLPFAEQDSTKIMQIIAYEPIASLASRGTTAPAHVIAAIDRALSKAPRERFESMADFMDALDGTPMSPPRLDDGPATIDAPAAANEGTATINLRPRSTEAPAQLEHPSRALVERNSPGSIEAPAEPAPPRPRWVLFLALMAASVAITSTVLVLRRSSTPSSTAPMVDDAGDFDDALSMPATVDDAMYVATTDAAVLANATDGAATDAAVHANATDAAVLVNATDAAPIDAARSPDAMSSLDAPPLDAATSSADVTHSKSRLAPEDIPPEIADDLKRAQAALDAGNTVNATRFAKLTLVKPTRRAYLILVEAACRSNDLAAARGWMRQMPTSIRTRAKNICAALGLEL